LVLEAVEEAEHGEERVRSFAERSHTSPYQNTVLIANIVGQVMTVGLPVIFLITRLSVLSHQSSRDIQLVVVPVWILILAFLVSLSHNITSFEMMIVSAAYAAVLSVFMTTVQTKN
jgi:uncharacterized membrane protein